MGKEWEEGEGEEKVRECSHPLTEDEEEKETQTTSQHSLGHTFTGSNTLANYFYPLALPSNGR